MLRNCRRSKGFSTGKFSFTLKTQLIFVIFKHILFDCFRFQFLNLIEHKEYLTKKKLFFLVILS